LLLLSVPLGLQLRTELMKRARARGSICPQRGTTASRRRTICGGMAKSEADWFLAEIKKDMGI